MSARHHYEVERDPLQINCIVSYTGAQVVVTVHHPPSSTREGQLSPHSQPSLYIPGGGDLNQSQSGGGSSSNVTNGSGDLREMLKQSREVVGGGGAAAGSGGGGESNNSSRGNSPAPTGSGNTTATTVLVAPPAAAPMTPRLVTKDLTLAICRQFFAVNTQINVISGASATPLRDETPLDPHLSEDNELFLFFDPRLLPKIQSEVPSSQAVISAFIRRQRTAWRLLGNPLRVYFDRLQQETEKLRDSYRNVEEQVLTVEQRLPEYMTPLTKIRLQEDSTKTLADMCSDGEKRLQLAKEHLVKIGQGLAAKVASCDQTGVTLETLLQKTHSNFTSPLLGKSVDELAGLSRELQDLILDRQLEVKHFMRQVDEHRHALSNDLQLIEVIRQGLVKWVNFDLMKDLPKAYDAGVEVAKKRLVLHLALKRVNTTLAIEAHKVQEEVNDFVRTWGRKFPSNILPEINAPVTAGKVPRDLVATLLEQNMTDSDFLDDDPASKLMQELGLAGTGQPQSARRPASKGETDAGVSDQQSESSKIKREQVSAQISHLSEQIDELTAKNLQLALDLENKSKKNDDLEAQLSRLALELGEEKKRTVDFEQLQKDFVESQHKLLRLKEGREGSTNSPPPTPQLAKGSKMLVTMPSPSSTMSLSSLIRQDTELNPADLAVISAGVANRDFFFMRFDRTFIANATFAAEVSSDQETTTTTTAGGDKHFDPASQLQSGEEKEITFHSVGVTMILDTPCVRRIGLLNEDSKNFVKEGELVKCTVILVPEGRNSEKMGKINVVRVEAAIAASHKKSDVVDKSPEKKTKSDRK